MRRRNRGTVTARFALVLDVHLHVFFQRFEFQTWRYRNIAQTYRQQLVQRRVRRLSGGVPAELRASKYDILYNLTFQNVRNVLPFVGEVLSVR